jgi:hypothetical protein
MSLVRLCVLCVLRDGERDRRSLQEGVRFVADLDLDQRRDWLDLFPMLATRRPETYGALLEPGQAYGALPRSLVSASPRASFSSSLHILVTPYSPPCIVCVCVALFRLLKLAHLCSGFDARTLMLHTFASLHHLCSTLVHPAHPSFLCNVLAKRGCGHLIFRHLIFRA